MSRLLYSLPLALLSSFSVAQAQSAAPQPAPPRGAAARLALNTPAPSPAPSAPTTQVLQGRIVDEEGHALPGATIQVKNSREVYITNSDGYFSFSTTQPGAAVQISLAGYYDATQQLQPGAAPTHTLQRLPGTRIKRSGRNAGKITAVGKAAE